MKSILLSIKPEWLAKILNGEKPLRFAKDFLSKAGQEIELYTQENMFIEGE